MAERPRNIRSASSGNENERTIARTNGSSITMMTVPMTPPIADAHAEIPSAMPPLPCRVIGYPSSIVAAFGVAPGVFSKIAEIEPANDCPASAAQKRIIVFSGPIPPTSGIMSAIPTAPLKPGIKPVNMPFAIPSTKNINPDQDNMIPHELKNASVRPIFPTFYRRTTRHIQKSVKKRGCEKEVLVRMHNAAAPTLPTISTYETKPFAIRPGIKACI